MFGIRQTAESRVTPEIWDEGLLIDADWRELRDGTAVPAGTTDFKRFLSEEHHRAYGRPWSIGRDYFNFLRVHGLRRSNKVLDFGCGSGRLGIWIIEFLHAGGYTGVDHHWEAVDAFCRYELPLHDLERKRPRIVLDGSLNVGRLNRRFDVILDCFVSFHLSHEDKLKLYSSFAGVMVRSGRVFTPHTPSLSTAELSSLGLKVVQSEVVPSSFLVGHLPEAKAKDHWHIISRH